MCVLVFLGLGYLKRQQGNKMREMNEYMPLLTNPARKYGGFVLEQSEEQNAAKKTKLKMEILKMMPIIILVVIAVGLLCTYLQNKFDQVIDLSFQAPLTAH